MDLFYCNFIEGDLAVLDEQESMHCIKVLRHHEGDKIFFTDGSGNKYTSTLIHANNRKCQLKIETVEQEAARNFNLHIAIAPPKAIDRFEWFLEKATELGIERITPILSRYSERKHLNTERCLKILISAMKQSGRVFLPQLDDLTDIKQFLKADITGVKAIAHCASGEKKMLTNLLSNVQQFTVLIGPEGDFSEEEIKIATGLNFSGISLGEKRLRTETAAVHICSIASYKH